MKNKYRNLLCLSLTSLVLFGCGSISVSNNTSSLTSSSETGTTSTSGTTIGTSSITYAYTDFTSDEKALFNSCFGFVIPFVPTNEYYVNDLYYEQEGILNYYAIGNSKAEFEAYLEVLKSTYTYDGTDVDEYGDTWYFYSKDNYLIDVAYYYGSDVGVDNYLIDVYIYENTEDTGGTGGDIGGSDTDYEYEHISVSEFINKKDSNNFYTLIGTIKQITNSTYGNFILEDETGSIFVWGLLTEKGSTNKTAFSTLGLAVGDKIALAGTYDYYNSQHEVVDAYFIEKIDGSQNDDGNINYAYTDFTSDEKALFNSCFGFVIPFVPTNDYYVDNSYYEQEGLINYYSIGNTEVEFEAYLEVLKSTYTYDGTDVDEYGDTWYLYSKDNYFIDVAYYYGSDVGVDDYLIDVYIYENTEDTGGTGGGTDENGQIVTSEGTIYTNNGKGLPVGENGVYEIDFTSATKAKDVTELGYYINGCPTTGNVNVLVIPVQFTDCLASKKGYDISAIDLAFNGGEKENELIYSAVSTYFSESSNDKLNLTFDVLDSWYTAKETTSYYLEYGEDNNPDQLILNDALTELANTMDLSKYDSDGNGSIDAVCMINTFDISSDGNILQWAYRYWNFYYEDGQNYFLHDGVYANDYLWASYQFLLETSSGFNGTEPNNTYTFIHEFGHVLGADDYYDTSYTTTGPLEGYDIMDAGYGDHNPYTKFNYGWITTSKLIVADESVTVSLNDFSTTGETIIIANNWDDSLGAYQEYYIVAYYKDSYFNEDGIVMYHVNASLLDYKNSGQYIVYNTNDASGDYATGDYLIEWVKNGNSYVYGVGDSSSSTITDDLGNTISYTFNVDSIASGLATITFTKN